jgi:hypothetical protein
VVPETVLTFIDATVLWRIQTDTEQVITHVLIVTMEDATGRLNREFNPACWEVVILK